MTSTNEIKYNYSYVPELQVLYQLREVNEKEIIVNSMHVSEQDLDKISDVVCSYTKSKKPLGENQDRCYNKDIVDKANIAPVPEQPSKL